MMDNIRKKIFKVGGSASIYLDAKLLYASGLKIGDLVEMKPMKNKIIISKVRKEEIEDER